MAMYVVRVADSQGACAGYLWGGRAVRLANARIYSAPCDARAAISRAARTDWTLAVEPITRAQLRDARALDAHPC